MVSEEGRGGVTVLGFMDRTVLYVGKIGCDPTHELQFASESERGTQFEINKHSALFIYLVFGLFFFPFLVYFVFLDTFQKTPKV